MRTLSFTDTELGVLWRLLKMAGDDFSNHGCNDFDLPMTEESVALVNSIIERNNDPLEEQVAFNAHKPRLMFNNDRLMSHFARLFREATETPELEVEKPKTKQKPPWSDKPACPRCHHGRLIPDGSRSYCDLLCGYEGTIDLVE